MNNELRFDFLTKSEFFLDFYELRQTFIYQFHEKDEIYKIYVPKKSGSEINVYQVCKNSDIYPEWFHLFHHDHPLPFSKGKSYVVSDWDPCYTAGTGGGTEYIESKKCKVLENSAFMNAYDTFTFGTRIFRDDDSGIPYVLVRVSYGEYRGHNVYLRSDKIIQNA